MTIRPPIGRQRYIEEMVVTAKAGGVSYENLVVSGIISVKKLKIELKPGSLTL